MNNILFFIAKAIEKCRCIDPQNFFTNEQLRSVNYTVCGNQTSSSLDELTQAGDDLRGFRDLHCLATMSRNHTLNCKHCRRPCFERLYLTSVSASGPWPNPVFQLDFYRRFIRRSKFSDRFRQYGDINSAVENRSMESVSENKHFIWCLPRRITYSPFPLE